MIMLSFYSVSEKKIRPKIVIGPLNEFGILQVCLRPLEYIIRFLIKLLVKLRFGDSEIFLRFCSLLIFFPPQKPPKNHHTSLKKLLAKLLFKLCFGGFRIFSTLCSLCSIIPPKKLLKNHHTFMKKVFRQANLFCYLK